MRTLTRFAAACARLESAAAEIAEIAAELRGPFGDPWEIEVAASAAIAEARNHRLRVAQIGADEVCAELTSIIRKQ